MNLLKRLFALAPERRPWMILSIVLSGCATVISFVPYFYFWSILREITGSAHPERIRRFALLVFLWTILRSVCYFLSLIASHIFAFRIESNMKKRGLQALLSASFAFFDTESSGRARKIIDDNSANTHTLVAHLVPDSVNAVLFPLGLLTLSFLAGADIGLIAVAALLFSALCFKMMYGKQSDSMMKDYLGALERINAETVEYIRGIQVIKIFNTGVASFGRLHRAILHYSEVVNEQCRACRFPYILFQTIMFNLGALFIPAALLRLRQGEAVKEVVCLLAFVLTFSGLLMNGIMKIMFLHQNKTTASDALEKSETLFRRMSERQLQRGSTENMTSFDLCFRDVRFSYDKERPILSHFHLHLPAGKVYALVGPSGGGKSTIAKLVSGFYPIDEGEILIGGIPITRYSEHTLTQNIAFVFQDARLFPTSILENVRLARPEASEEEVLRALRDARCEDILAKFPEREHTRIGSQGVFLSGGEVQRICVARALLKKAPIVILDEAVAAGDPDNEFEMQCAFAELMRGKTVLIIAHRLSGIRNADEILFVENGEVTERGKHEELIARNGRYAQLSALYEQAAEWRLS